MFPVSESPGLAIESWWWDLYGEGKTFHGAGSDVIAPIRRNLRAFHTLANDAESYQPDGKKIARATMNR